MDKFTVPALPAPSRPLLWLSLNFGLLAISTQKQVQHSTRKKPMPAFPTPKHFL